MKAYTTLAVRGLCGGVACAVCAVGWTEFSGAGLLQGRPAALQKGSSFVSSVAGGRVEWFVRNGLFRLVFFFPVLPHWVMDS